MRLQRRFTQRITIGVTPDQAEQLQLLADRLEADVSTVVREWIKIGLQQTGIASAPRPSIANGHAHHEAA